MLINGFPGYLGFSNVNNCVSPLHIVYGLFTHDWFGDDACILNSFGGFA